MSSNNFDHLFAKNYYIVVNIELFTFAIPQMCLSNDFVVNFNILIILNLFCNKISTKIQKITNSTRPS